MPARPAIDETLLERLRENKERAESASVTRRALVSVQDAIDWLGSARPVRYLLGNQVARAAPGAILALGLGWALGGPGSLLAGIGGGSVVGGQVALGAVGQLAADLLKLVEKKRASTRDAE